MNFRINMSHQEVLDLCKETKYNDLLSNDEFTIAKKKTGKEIFQRI